MTGRHTQSQQPGMHLRQEAHVPTVWYCCVSRKVPPPESHARHTDRIQPTIEAYFICYFLALDLGVCNNQLESLPTASIELNWRC